MKNQHSGEIPSYRDPLGARKEAAQKRREALEAQFPQAAQSYDGFYLRINKILEKGGNYLLGAEGIIGSPLQFDNTQLSLLASDGTCIAKLENAPEHSPEFNEAVERLATYAKAGWTIKAFIATTFFKAEDKSVGVDIAFICWAPLGEEYETALDLFAHNISERLASGDRAGLQLLQEQFISVLKSGGTWYLTKAVDRPPFEKGTVVYKGRRSGVERITAYALKHRVGCNVLATIFWLVLAAGIVALVWNLFF